MNTTKGANLPLRTLLVSTVLCLLLTSVPAWPQDPPPPEKKLGWQDKLVEADLLSPITGLPVGILVPVQADKLDTLVNVALVVNF